MLYIINREGRMVDTLQSDVSINNENVYFDDVLLEDLSTGSETLSFSMIANAKTSSNVKIGNYIVYIRNNKKKLFQIIETIEERTDVLIKNVYCECAGLELLNTVYPKNEFNNVNVSKFLENVLQDTNWRVGYVDSSLNKFLAISIDESEIYTLIQEHIKKFDCEIEFRVEFKNNKIIGRYIDVFKKRGNNFGVRLTLGKELEKITRKIDMRNFATKLIGENKNGMTFNDISAPDKPLGQNFITNDVAYEQFNQNGKHIERKFVYDTEDANELLLQTRKELEKVSTPSVTYEIDTSIIDMDKYNLGDTVTVTDYSFVPPLMITARVVSLETSKTNKDLNKATLSNFVEVKSYINKVGSTDILDNAISGEHIQTEYTNKIIADAIDASLIEVDKVVADKANIKDLEAINADIKNLKADKADIGELNAINATIENLKAKDAEIDNIFAGNITSDMMQTGTITAGSGIIADGAIGSAQISALDAGKISSGKIDTSKVEVIGQDGHLKIKGNRMQVFQGIGAQAKERVSIGDVNGDGTIYGLRVRGVDGQTILLDENGVTKEGITDGSITNEKISDNADIDGSKLNINSVVSKINEDGTEVIKGTKIEVNGTNLETKLSTIETKQTEDGKKISQNSSKITANEKAIALKVDSQTYQTDKENMTTQLSKNTSAISVLEKDIKLKVEQTDITNAITDLKIGGTNLARYTDFTITDVVSKWTKSPSAYATLTMGKYENFGQDLPIDAFIKGQNILRLRSDIAQMVANNQKYAFTNLVNVDDRVLILEPQTEYTLSFWTYLSGNTELSWGSVLRVGENGSTSSSIARTENISEYTGSFVYREVTFKTDDNTKYFLRFYNQHKSTLTTGNSDIHLYNIKLEKGNKATPWSVCPLDIQTSISNVKTEVIADLDGFKTEVSKNYYNKNDIDSKGYATTSALEQTATDLKIKFEESGGYNLLYNSDFTRDVEKWSPTTGLTWTTFTSGLSSPSGGGIRLVGTMGASRYLVQYMTDPKIVANSSFTMSAYVYVSSAGSTNPITDGSTIAFRIYSRITYTDDTKEYKYAFNKNASNTTINKWQRVSLSFDKTAGKTIKEITFSIEVKDTTRYFYVSQAMLERGKTASPWSPNPNEVYDGITQIDKDGITVTSSNVKSKTQMSADGFKITKTDTNKDVFKVNANGTLSIEGSLYSSSADSSQIVNIEDGSIMCGVGGGRDHQVAILNNSMLNYQDEIYGDKGINFKPFGDHMIIHSLGNEIKVYNNKIETNKSAFVYNGNTILNGTDTWLRTYGATGWMNTTYTGGWYMTDATWIRTYGNKDVYINKMLRADAGLQIGTGGATFNANTTTFTYKGNKIYHAGAKPTASEIGASASNHDHSGTTINPDTMVCRAFGNGGTTLMHNSLDGNSKNLGWSGSKFNQLSAKAVWADQGSWSDRGLKENIRYLDNVDKEISAFIPSDVPFVINENLETKTDLVIQKEDLFNFIKNDLKLAQYNYINDYANDGFNNKINFIANDVIDTKVGSILCAKHEDNLAYNLNNYISIVVGALQEEIYIRESENNELKNRVKTLEDELQKIKECLGLS